MHIERPIKITFLGTGTSQGVPIIGCNCEVCKSSDSKDKRLRSSILIQVKDKNIVIDAGPDFRQQMLKQNLQKLDSILISHEHVDHIFGLDDIRSFNWRQKKPMDIYAEHRVEVAIKRIFDYVFASTRYPGIPQMMIHRIENKPFTIDDLTVIPIRGMHYRLPVFGYRIADIAYITDVNFISKEEKQKLHNLDILIVNALRKSEHISHFNLSQALELIEELAPQRSYLTHMSHEMGFHNNLENELPENVFPAYDGLELESKLES